MYDPVHLAGDPEILPHYGKLHVGLAVYEGKLARYPEWARLMAAIPEVRFG